MAPVYEQLVATGAVDVQVIATGQHQQQLSQALRPFSVAVSSTLDLMREPGEALTHHFSRLVQGVGTAIDHIGPDYVLVHGDTLSCAAAGWAAFLEEVPFAHVEAGLRSNNLTAPFPEEASRRTVDHIADLLLAPTPNARRNLLNEGIDPSRIIVTGQTAVDAVLSVHACTKRAHTEARRVVVTLHRRENWARISALVSALARLASDNPAYEFVLPMHLNPDVRSAIASANANAPNLFLMEPLNYVEMLELLATSVLIVTDSGGLQEEGITLGIPVVVVRETTERPEAIDCGGAILAGTHPDSVAQKVQCLLKSPTELKAMAHRPNPFGDGGAGRRVARAVEWRLLGGPRPEDWKPSERVGKTPQGLEVPCTPAVASNQVKS